MEFSHRYAGSSSVKQRDAGTELAFAPDTLREPTYFRGQIKKQVEFREAMSALHDVVISDLRFVPKDRSAYLAWREQQGYIDLGAIMQDKAKLQSDIVQAQQELTALTAASAKRMSTFYAARGKYFDHLYQRDRELWFKLDPIISVHPDQLFFECFSRDESSYGRLAVSYNVFSQLGDRANGTTNIDYSEKLYGEFQKIRSYKETTLDIDPTGFSVATSLEQEYREVKIAVPDSWVRGLLQVSSAMTMPAHVIDLHPMDVHNLCLTLRRNKELFGPRSLRFVLRPGAPVSIKMDPWDKVIACPRSKYVGDSSTEIQIWGRRRLHVLERLLPLAKSVKLFLLGSGLPSFWVVDMGELSFTLGLSGWTNNNWSEAGNFDLLATREEVDELTQQRVFDELGRCWHASAAQLAQSTNLDRAVVSSALVGWTQNGKAMFDLENGVYRKRELSREPLPMSSLRYANAQETAAAQLLHEGKVAVDRASESDGALVLNGRVEWRGKAVACKVAFDKERRMVSAECQCDYYIRNKLYKGPCQHMLALRAAHRRGVSDVVVSAGRDVAAATSDATAVRQSVVTRLARAIGLRRTGNVEPAIAELRELERLAAAGSAELLSLREQLAEAAIDSGQPAAALATALLVLKQDPHNELGLRVATDAACVLKQYDVAMQYGLQFAKLKNLPVQWLSLSQIATAANDTAKALSFTDAGLQSHPDNALLLAERERLTAKPVKMSWFRKVVNAVTGKKVLAPETPQMALDRKVVAAVEAVAGVATVPDRDTLHAALMAACQAPAGVDQRVFSCAIVVKRLCRDLPTSDQELIALLRGALS